MRAAAAGRIAGHVEQVLDREGQPGERPGSGLRHLDGRIRQEGAGGIGIQEHGVLVGLSKVSYSPASGGAATRPARISADLRDYEVAKLC